MSLPLDQAVNASPQSDSPSMSGDYRSSERDQTNWAS